MMKKLKGRSSMTRPLIVEIYGAKTENSVTKYGIRVTVHVEENSGRQKLMYSLRRRFREFLALDSKLRRMFKDHELPSMPPKTVFKCYNDSFIKERQSHLQKYLDDICDVPYLRNGPQLRSFLLIDKKTEQPIAPTQVISNYPANTSNSRRRSKSNFDFYDAVCPSDTDFLITASADRSSFGKKKKFTLLSACVPAHRGVLQVFRQVDVEKFTSRFGRMRARRQTRGKSSVCTQKTLAKHHQNTLSQSSSESRGTTIKHSRPTSQMSTGQFETEFAPKTPTPPDEKVLPPVPEPLDEENQQQKVSMEFEEKPSLPHSLDRKVRSRAPQS